MKLIFVALLTLNSLILFGCNVKLTDNSNKAKLVLFGGTYCGHCVSSIPIFKKNIYDVYSDSIDIFVNVIDGKKFDINGLNQGYNPNITFEKMSGSECNYVPSWVLVDKNSQLIMKSCGNEKTFDDMKSAIQNLISTN